MCYLVSFFGWVGSGKVRSVVVSCDMVWYGQLHLFIRSGKVGSHGVWFGSV